MEVAAQDLLGLRLPGDDRGRHNRPQARPSVLIGGVIPHAHARQASLPDEAEALVREAAAAAFAASALRVVRGPREGLASWSRGRGRRAPGTNA